MGRGAKIWLAALPVAVGLWAASAASACPCAEFCGRVVAHGSSLYGVPWRITASTRRIAGSRPTAELEFSVHACGEYSEAGYSSSFGLPAPRWPFLIADPGSEIDAYPESDLSGFTSNRVMRLGLRMSDGTTIDALPEPAPRRLFRQLPWLRRLRFFDQFFAAGIRPVAVTVFGRGGRALGSTRPRHGFFAWSGR
jgi:hypothetical protein